MTKKEALKLVKKWELDYEEFFKSGLDSGLYDPDPFSLKELELYQNNRNNDNWALKPYLIKVPAEETHMIATASGIKGKRGFSKRMPNILKKYGISYILASVYIGDEEKEIGNEPLLQAWCLSIPIQDNDIAYKIGRVARMNHNIKDGEFATYVED